MAESKRQTIRRLDDSGEFPIGEPVMYHLGRTPSRSEPRWSRGLYLGCADRNLSFVGIEGKVIKAQSLRRLAKEDRADPALLNKIAGSPWQLGNEEHGDGPGVAVEELPIGRRRTYLRRGVEFAQHGYTPHCPGCEAARLRQAPRAHTEMCRRRVERLMGESEKGRRRLEETQVRMDAREVEDDRKRSAEGSVGVEPDMYRVRFEGPSAPDASA
eukprot:2838616-Amphidinium_carterae.1